MFDHEHAFATARDVMSADGSRPSINQITMKYTEGHGVRLYATDSYRAVRISMPRMPEDYGLDGTDPKVWTPGKGTLTLDMWNEFSRPVNRYQPKIDPLYDKAYGESTEYTLRHAAPYATTIANFGYFDGERRKPNGMIRLEWVTDIGAGRLELDAYRGMKVQDPRIGRNFMAWEETPITIGTVTDAKPSDVDDKVLGHYSATYVTPIDRAEKFWHSTEMRPLLIVTNSGTQEHLIMPVRM